MKINGYLVGVIGTNCYLVWDEETDEAMLIDPGDYDAAITRDIADNGLWLKYIVVTHGHGDHIGGAPGFLAEFPEAKLVCGKDDIPLVSDTDLNISAMFVGKKVVIQPDIFPVDGDVLKLGNLSFVTLATPGHSAGGLSFYVAECSAAFKAQAFSGTVFSGDTLLNVSVGRTDQPGGDFNTLRSSIRNILFKLPDDTLVLPGHMDPTTIGREKRFNPFVS